MWNFFGLKLNQHGKNDQLQSVAQQDPKQEQANANEAFMLLSLSHFISQSVKRILFSFSFQFTERKDHKV